MTEKLKNGIWQMKLLLIMAVILVLIFTACGDGSGNNNGGTTDTSITYSVAQIGGTANTVDSTGITFTFSESINDLNVTASDITLTGTAEKGAATFTGTGVNWTLSPITVNSAGSVTVSITKDGITSATQNVNVFKESGGSQDITFIISQIGGTADTVDSTGISFTFSESINDLNVTASDISLTGSAEKGAATFTGTGVNWTLSPITVNSAGNVTVGITKNGIVNTTESTSVHKAVTGTSSGVTINRADSTSTAFVFSVAPVAGENVVYNVYKGDEVVAFSYDPAVISVSEGLNWNALTPLTVKAENAGGVLWEAGLQGMLKYGEEMPTRDAYHDWFRFLAASLPTLNSVNDSASAGHASFLTDIRTVLNAGQPLDEEGGIEYKDMYEGQSNNAMAAVLANYGAIVDRLVDQAPTQPVAAERLETLNETLPRLWFNQVTGQASSSFGHFNNDAAINNMMKAENFEEDDTISMLLDLRSENVRMG